MLDRQHNEFKNSDPNQPQLSKLERYKAAKKLYQNGKAPKEDQVEAIREFRLLADAGYAPAQSVLADCYLWGSDIAGIAVDQRKAVSLLKRAADKGYAHAQYQLGDFYLREFPPHVYREERLSLYQRAADQGHLEALDRLPYIKHLYESNKPAPQVVFVEPKYEQLMADAQYRDAKAQLRSSSNSALAEALYLLKRAARLGHKEASYDLGVMYEHGYRHKSNGGLVVLEPDKNEAHSWYEIARAKDPSWYAQVKAQEKAKEEGEGLFRTAVRYQNGDDDFPKDLKIAMSYFESAIKKGVDCTEELENCRREARASAFKLAADQGDPEGQYGLGYCYEHGIGVAQDLAEAVKLYESAAAQDHPDALHALGRHYESVKEECDLVVKRLYEKAAEQGRVFAQYDLGRCHERGGLGVPKNPIEAARLYTQAAMQGCAPAQHALGLCYENGLGVPKDLIEAARLYKQAADRGYAPAQYKLSHCYFMGRGITQNTKEALSLCRLAASQDDPSAQAALKDLEEFETAEILSRSSRSLSKEDRKILWGSHADASVEFMHDVLAAMKEFNESKEQAQIRVSEKREQALKRAEKNLAEEERRVEESKAEAEKRFRALANKGCLPARYKFSNEAGVLDQLAEEGYAPAQYDLGFYYHDLGSDYENEESEQNRAAHREKAVALFKLAADQGHMPAQVALGHCYEHGIGVSKNLIETARFYKLAAEQGDQNEKWFLRDHPEIRDNPDGGLEAKDEKDDSPRAAPLAAAFGVTSASISASSASPLIAAPVATSIPPAAISTPAVSLPVAASAATPVALVVSAPPVVVPASAPAASVQPLPPSVAHVLPQTFLASASPKKKKKKQKKKKQQAGGAAPAVSKVAATPPP